MKTAMQELRKKIIELINDSKDTGTNRDNSDYRIGLYQALGLIDFEAEKEQIIEAYNEGKGAVKCNSDESTEDFYNRTYKA